MIYTERAILKRIRNLSHHSPVRILTLDGHLINPETGESIDCTDDYGGELYAIIKALIQFGYLESLEEYKVMLTDKGIHPYAYKWEDIKHFLFHSVAVPVVVSIITTIITLNINAW